MLRFKLFGIEIRLNFLFFAVLTVILLTDQTGIPIWALIASCIHECGHMVAFFCFHQTPRLISFELGGIRMQGQRMEQLKTWQEAVILLAGSGVNFLVSFLHLAVQQNLFASIHLLIGCFNLLPVKSLDGGKLLELLFQCIFPFHLAYRSVQICSWGFCLLLLIFGGYLAYHLNFTLLAFGIYLLISLLAEHRKQT